MNRVLGLAGSLALVFAIACGGSNAGSGSGGGQSGDTTGSNNTTTTGTGTSFSCCLNGQHFSCPSANAVDQCFSNFDPSQCVPDNGTCGGTTGSGSTGSSGPTGSGSGTTTTGSTGSGSGSTGSGGDDLGKQCQFNSDCINDICLVAEGADFGYCSKNCMDFTECPNFWDCTTVGNATGLYCVQ